MGKIIMILMVLLLMLPHSSISIQEVGIEEGDEYTYIIDQVSNTRYNSSFTESDNTFEITDNLEIYSGESYSYVLLQPAKQMGTSYSVYVGVKIHGVNNPGNDSDLIFAKFLRAGDEFITLDWHNFRTNFDDLIEGMKNGTHTPLPNLITEYKDIKEEFYDQEEYIGYMISYTLVSENCDCSFEYRFMNLYSKIHGMRVYHEYNEVFHYLTGEDEVTFTIDYYLEEHLEGFDLIGLGGITASREAKTVVKNIFLMGLILVVLISRKQL